MKSADLIVGLGYGDEGKGTLTDWLCRGAAREGEDDVGALVVRYSGGAQAAHNVVEPGPGSSGQGSWARHHCFQQFGAGTFAGARTYLSRFMLVNPISLVREGAALRAAGVADPFSLLAVDDRALVTTPFHIAAGRIREMTRARHGSCGLGIGETRKDSLHGGPTLRVGTLRDSDQIEAFLRAQQEKKRDEMRPLVEGVRGEGHEAGRANEVEVALAREWRTLDDPDVVSHVLARFADFTRQVRFVDEAWWRRELERDQHLVFEGAQGVLLDETWGFHPHTTWTNVTFDNALALLAGYTGPVRRIGVTRAYQTRHGAGPFVTEDAALRPLSAHDHNRPNEWQEGFRSGWLDLVTLRYALEVVGGVDELAVTNVDRLAVLDGPAAAVTSYQGPADAIAVLGPTGARPGVARRIEVRRPPTVAHQEALTRALCRCAPGDVVSGPRDGRDFARFVAELAEVPLGIVSHGPTFVDKTREGAPR